MGDIGDLIGGLAFVVCLAAGGTIVAGTYYGFNALTNIGGYTEEGNIKNKLVTGYNDENDKLTSKLADYGLSLPNGRVMSWSADVETGNVHGTVLYDGKDKDGDMTTYIASWKCDADKETIENLKNDPLVKSYKVQGFYDNEVKDAGINGWYPFSSYAAVDKYDTKVNNFLGTYTSFVDSTSNFEVTPMGELQNVNKSLSKVGAGSSKKLVSISDIALNSDGTMARFYVDYLTNSTDKGLEIQEVKVNIDVKDFDGEIKEQFTDYVFAKFTEGEIDSFKKIDPEQSREQNATKLAMDTNLNKEA